VSLPMVRRCSIVFGRRCAARRPCVAAVPRAQSGQVAPAAGPAACLQPRQAHGGPG
jgi:hypothetical protein